MHEQLATKMLNVQQTGEYCQKNDQQRTAVLTVQQLGAQVKERRSKSEPVKRYNNYAKLIK